MQTTHADDSSRVSSICAGNEGAQHVLSMMIIALCQLQVARHEGPKVLLNVLPAVSQLAPDVEDVAQSCVLDVQRMFEQANKTNITW